LPSSILIIIVQYSLYLFKCQTEPRSCCERPQKCL